MKISTWLTALGLGIAVVGGGAAPARAATAEPLAQAFARGRGRGHIEIRDKGPEHQPLRRRATAGKWVQVANGPPCPREIKGAARLVARRAGLAADLGAGRRRRRDSASDPVASVIRLEFDAVPVVDQQLPGPNAAGAIDLPANLVAIGNKSGANTRLMGSGSTAHVGAWDRTGTAPSWEFSGSAGK